MGRPLQRVQMVGDHAGDFFDVFGNRLPDLLGGLFAPCQLFSIGIEFLAVDKAVHGGHCLVPCGHSLDHCRWTGHGITGGKYIRRSGLECVVIHFKSAPRG